MEPTFAGLALFGPAPEFKREDPPNAAQVIHFPGLRGTMRRNLGMAGARTRVRGLMQGVDADALAAAFATLQSAKEEGVMRVLIDTKNRSWPDAILEDFRETGRPVRVAGYWGRGWGQTYEATFYHTGWRPAGG